MLVNLTFRTQLEPLNLAFSDNIKTDKPEMKWEPCRGNRIGTKGTLHWTLRKLEEPWGRFGGRQRCKRGADL